MQIMAETKTVAIVPLNEANYPTWRVQVQCRMALMKEGLWNIVNELRMHAYMSTSRRSG